MVLITNLNLKSMRNWRGEYMAFEYQFKTFSHFVPFKFYTFLFPSQEASASWIGQRDSLKSILANMAKSYEKNSKQRSIDKGNFTTQWLWSSKIEFRWWISMSNMEGLRRLTDGAWLHPDIGRMKRMVNSYPKVCIYSPWIMHSSATKGKKKIWIRTTMFHWQF